MSGIKKPNILFIMSDEHAPQLIGAYGAKFAITPNMDKLAERGVLFQNAYCPFPLCVPSRASMLSGKYPYKIRSYDISSPLSSSCPTWAHMLRNEGYRCLLIGKMHMVGPDQLHGFHEHLLENGPEIDGSRWGEEKSDGTAYRNWSRIKIVEDSEFGCIDMERTGKAIELIKNAKGEDAPWCITVGIGYPHYPQVCTRSAWNMYENADIPEPVLRGDVIKRNERWSDIVWGFNKFTVKETMNSRRAYLAMVTMLDGWIGDLIGALEESGQIENTVIIYTSDHGDMCGEQGFWGKNFFYEYSSKVPLIISAPSLGVSQNTRIETPVSLVDIYPTLRDLCGAEKWKLPLDGRSLWNACLGAENIKEVPVFCEYYACETIGPERMVRLGKWKLNYYHRQGSELFNLEEDPSEIRNLFEYPQYGDIIKILMDEILKDWSPEEIEKSVVEDQNDRALIGESLKKR